MQIEISFLFAAVVILAAVYYRLTRNKGYFHDKPIPSLPFKLFFGSTGSLLLKQDTFPRFVQSIYNKFPNSKVFGMYDLTTPLFVINDLDLIKQVSVKDFDHFVDRQPIFGSSQYEHPNLIIQHSLFTLAGQKWKNMRATLSPAFTGSKMRQMHQLIVECSENVVRFYLSEARTKGAQEYEMKDVFSRIANDVIATCAFGITVDSSKERNNEFFTNGKKMVDFSRISVIFRVIGHRILPSLMGRLGIDIVDAKQNTYFSSLILGAVKEREARGIVRPDMVNLLMQARNGTLKHQQEKEQHEGFATVQESEVGKAHVSNTMTDTEMVAQCLIFFLAGFEGVSTLLLFVAYELALNPTIQQKLYNEAEQTKSTLGGKSLTYVALQKMKYMDMVVSEALRRWSPASAIDRICVKDYVLDDGAGLKFTIEKGTAVWFPAYALHHDPKYFENPEKFDPERFSDERRDSINTGAYMPFGVGPRNCIGSRFALIEIKTVVYHMLLSFSFERTSKTEVPPVITKGMFQTTPQNGMHLELRPRESTTG